jgi:hypothetical protein
MIVLQIGGLVVVALLIAFLVMQRKHTGTSKATR